MKTIKLRDYAGKATEVQIDDNCDHIEGYILSGDMIMTYPFYCDSSNDRIMAFEDGRFYVSEKNFEKMNNISSSYDIQQLD